MTFPLLALICAVGLLGPLLAVPRKWRAPVVVGELFAGLIIGRSGFNWVDPAQPTFTFMADIGFALVMFVSGSQVPLRNAALKAALSKALVRQVMVVILAAAAGVGVAVLFGSNQAPMFAVLMASSSAALVLPIISSMGTDASTRPGVLPMMAQVAVADVLSIVALPLAMNPATAPRALLGSVAVIAAAVVIYFVLREANRRGIRRTIHNVSERRKFAVELRVQLVLLFALAGIAVWGHVSIMLAGFSFGLAVAAIGEPQRLAKQLFALTEGFFGPLFFVWLGASLTLQQLGAHPKMILLGLTLAAGTLLVHASTRLLGQPLPLGLLSAAQLGLPVAAATIGLQENLLMPGEASALMLGALVTIVVAAITGSRLKPPATATPVTDVPKPAS